jgi:glycosyltransferase involved in cell wall biosynthesis
LNELAKRVDADFVTTFGNPGNRVTVTGRVPYDDMKDMIHDASLYLATTKETFGIGTLEAMATGSPILGYRWGGTEDLVDHGVHGYLVEPGDIQGLVDGWHYCMANRQILGLNARDRALEYGWDSLIHLFIEAYDEAYELKRTEPDHDIGIVVPLHNYGRFVTETIDSIKSQVIDAKVHLVVVDDGSTDDSKSRAEGALMEVPSWLSREVISTPNQGVARARNLGASKINAKYICFLDADDHLGGPDTLHTLFTAMEANPQYGITYGRLASMNEAGTEFRKSRWPDKFLFDQHFRGINQIPTFCLIRKDLFDRSGGYRFQYQPSEDADLWTRLITVGAVPQLITEKVTLEYRMHDGSLSAGIRNQHRPQVEWLRDHPYSKDKRFPLPTMKDSGSWPMRDYDSPKVSIVIPVSEYHKHLYQRAVDSVLGQTEREWQLIIVDDTSSGLNTSANPFAIVTRGPRTTAGEARNHGASLASAPLLTFLDADDFFLPTFLQEHFKVHNQLDRRYSYSDWISITKDGRQEIGQSMAYSQDAVFNHSMIHTNNFVVRTKTFHHFGGYRSDFDTWEDIELIMRFASQGLCGHRIGLPLIAYDYRTGQLRENGLTRIDELKSKLVDLYGDYMGKDAKVCNCVDPKPVLSTAEALKAVEDGEMIRIRYHGPRGTVVGPNTKHNYGRRNTDDSFYIFPEDLVPGRFEPIPERVTRIEPTELPPAPTRVLKS